MTWSISDALKRHPIDQDILHLREMTKAGGTESFCWVPHEKARLHVLFRLLMSLFGLLFINYGAELWQTARSSLKVLTRFNCFLKCPVVDQVTQGTDWDSEATEGDVWRTALRTGKEMGAQGSGRKILQGSPVLKHTGPSLGMATPWEVGMLSRKAALKGGLPGVLVLTPL